ncbi:hypothetical protein ERJ75_001149000 [Trypanosoma vivax]|nr:hypothetical protein ERJ75_001149000 [Trypanosoma vivax]
MPSACARQHSDAVAPSLAGEAPDTLRQAPTNSGDARETCRSGAEVQADALQRWHCNWGTCSTRCKADKSAEGVGTARGDDAMHLESGQDETDLALVTRLKKRGSGTHGTQAMKDACWTGGRCGGVSAQAHRTGASGRRVAGKEGTRIRGQKTGSKKAAAQGGSLSKRRA